VGGPRTTTNECSPFSHYKRQFVFTLLEGAEVALSPYYTGCTVLHRAHVLDRLHSINYISFLGCVRNFVGIIYIHTEHTHALDKMRF
jgi:hypothetical protein